MAKRRKNARGSLANLVPLIWKQPLYALPFALFFGFIYGHGWRGYLLALEVSITFAYPIGVAVWLAHRTVPRLHLPSHDTSGGAVLRESAVYVGFAAAGAAVGALVTQFVWIHRFLNDVRSILLTIVWTLLFCVLFTALSYAISFYRRSLERGQAMETMRAELAQAELRTLRAQVNPHFLFNTLNSIASLIRVSPAAAEETTTRLADVFRYALQASGRERAPLGEELEFLRSYLAIEQTRLGDRLKVEVDVPAELLSVPVPSLLLQPLVENAVRHAIAPRAEGGHIRLVARAEDECLRIDVADDGPGLSAGSDHPGEGFGLRATQDRLNALGPLHALELDSIPGGGLRARVTLPLVPEVTAVPAAAGPSKECCDER